MHPFLQGKYSSCLAFLSGVGEWTYTSRGNAGLFSFFCRRHFAGSLLPVPCPCFNESTYISRVNAGRLSFCIAGSLLVVCTASINTDGWRQFGGSLMVVCSRYHVRVLVNGPMSPGEMLAVFLSRWRHFASSLLPVPCLRGSECTYVSKGHARLFAFTSPAVCW